MNGFRKQPLAATIGALALAMAAAAHAQDSAATGEDGAKDKKDAKEVIEEIVVTGSLIQRPGITDIAPVTVIDNEQMAERGLVSLGDVMQSMTENTGYSEGKASNLLGRFTTGAEEINMRGMGAGRTLVLVNGRRIADYPLPFGGEQNGVDFGAIPSAAISRVDYLSSGASATYGSDAVGGVVNLITKRDMEQTSANVTTGIYEQGFGEMVDASLVTGNSFERGSFTVGFQTRYNNDPLASDVEYLQDNAPYTAGMVSLAENSATGYRTLPVSAQQCSALGFDHDKGSCSQDVSDTISVYPRTEQYGAFFDGRFDLTDTVELFATAMGTDNSVSSRSNVLFWNGAVIREDANGNQTAATFITRGFSTDELGTAEFDNDQAMFAATVGAKGSFDVADDSWYWDASWSSARYDLQSTSINLKEEGIRNWMLEGAASVADYPDQQYTYVVDADFYDNRLTSNVLRPVLPADVDSLIGENRMEADSAADSLSFLLNGTLGDLSVFHEPVKFAVLAEYATQSMSIDPDARTLDTTGNGWYNIGAIAADGDRDRSAAAVEFDIPALADLDVSLSARYDHYEDDSDISGRATGQVKFLYRATDWMKVRGNYSQIFRAPDMFNIYGQSDAFQPVADFSQPGCYDGTTFDCSMQMVSTTRQPDQGLTEEHGDDVGLGVILMPTTNFVITADWYNITLKDLVVTESAQEMLQKEWQCANGELDPSSQLCADIASRILRNNNGGLEKVLIRPINQDELTRQGLDLRAQLNFEFEQIGSFNASLSHSKVLDSELKRFAGDETIDIRYGEPGASTPENVTNLALSWFNPLTTGRAVSAGLFALRYGKVYNYSHTQFMDPMYSVNLVAGYQMNAKTQLRLTVNNLFDTQPEANDSGFWPGYWEHLQTDAALGRSYYLTVGYSFD